MSDTPRTDALLERYSGKHFLDDTECVRLYQLARELEREVSKNARDAERYRHLMGLCNGGWRGGLNDLIDAAIAAHAEKFVPCVSRAACPTPERCARLGDCCTSWPTVAYSDIPSTINAGGAISKSGDREVADQPGATPGAAGTCTNQFEATAGTVNVSGNIASNGSASTSSV